MFDIDWANQQSIPFHFGRSLGKGRSGQVYEGENRETGTKQALKVLPKFSKITDYEHSVMKILPKHSNIVFMESCFDLGDSLRVFVLDLCDTNLYVYMRENGGKLKCEQAQRVMKCMINGLEVLYHNNIFHRDLKPENIFLTVNQNGDLIVKLGDFGLSKQLTSENQLSYSRTGSPLYLAPEIWSGEGYTSKSDIYSCGIVLYEMVTGHPPFYRSQNALQLRRSVLYIGVTEEDIGQLSLDDDGKSLVRSLTQKCPKKRISWKDFFAHPWFSETKKI